MHEPIDAAAYDVALTHEEHETTTVRGPEVAVLLALAILVAWAISYVRREVG